jgi:3-hydroxyacyl-CoA dehydrogenase
MRKDQGLSIGVIGTGIMGADHVETITAAVSGAEVRAVTDIDPKRAERAASNLPGAKLSRRLNSSSSRREGGLHCQENQLAGIQANIVSGQFHTACARPDHLNGVPAVSFVHAHWRSRPFQRA